MKGIKESQVFVQCKTLAILFAGIAFLSLHHCSAQDSELELSEIMKGKDFVGHWPERPQWSPDGNSLYFYWNPDGNPSDSIYRYSLIDSTVHQLTRAEEEDLIVYNYKTSPDQTHICYALDGDIYLKEIKDERAQQLTFTIDIEKSPKFLFDNFAVAFTAEDNAFLWREGVGIIQLTNIQKGYAKAPKRKNNDWIAKEERSLMHVLNKRENQKELRKERERNPKESSVFYLEDRRLSSLNVSPQADYVFFRLVDRPEIENTAVPNFITASAHTEDLSARPKVGGPQSKHTAFLYDIVRDTFLEINTKKLPTIETEGVLRKTYISDARWNKSGNKAFVEVQAIDNKDRWIANVNLETGILEILDHQHDDAWIGGPGISSWRGFASPSMGWWDENSIWFQSEETGFSHLYLLDTDRAKKTAITKGEFEIYDPKPSKDRKGFYYHSNEDASGQRHFYYLDIENKNQQQLTQNVGHYDVELSPDEKYLAYRFSSANQPWELFIQANQLTAESHQITDSQSETYKAYEWRLPEIVNFEAQDGNNVTARLYRPKEGNASGAAVIFVHGAGYLQNAHQWWSTYFREYMFHNLLVDKGYTVLDIDYRGSAGYGRDWRTGIYRFMGDKDLSDQVDGATFLVENHEIDPARIGIYGGSYGGFITLMALFTEGQNFACGAALRSVSDWAHYNHLYTSNILNTPETDSIAYRRSSPIYYADGLEDPLLICHGMVDTNVHFQDVVRLSQRLIELEKKDWELAVYPMEGHAFREASSWRDEYSRILKLFEEHLR